jgi:hypothetical protein
MVLVRIFTTNRMDSTPTPLSAEPEQFGKTSLERSLRTGQLGLWCRGTYRDQSGRACHSIYGDHHRIVADWQLRHE